MAAGASLSEALITEAERTRQPFDPEVTLFLDNSPESSEAGRMFAVTDEGVRVVSEPHVRVPTAVFAFSVYEGLPAIAELVQELQSLRQATIAAYDRHVRRQPGSSLEPHPVASRLT